MIAKQEILWILERKGWTTPVELGLSALSGYDTSDWDNGIFQQLLHELITSGEIVELVYKSPEAPDRTILFKKGTTFKFGDGGVDGKEREEMALDGEGSRDAQISLREIKRET